MITLPRRNISILILVTALLLSAGLSWFAICNYNSATPDADDNMRGLALTFATAMEGGVNRDSSLETLSTFKSIDIAYIMLISSSGKILFHSNEDLIGNNVGDDSYREVLMNGSLVEKRVELGTGEFVYEFQLPFHLFGKTCVLRLALHTWSSEVVIRRARFGAVLIFSLLAIGWVLGGTVFWLLHRQDTQEKQLARQHELARLGEVGAVLAHEVRNPLAGIKGYGQLLEERLQEGKERDYAQLIVRESLRLEQLVDDILFFTRTDPGIYEYGDLHLVSRELTDLLAPQLDESGISMVENIEEKSLVHCHAEALHRLLLNLLTNAIQAMPEGGVIDLKAHRNGEMLEIAVADNGPGIDAGIRSELFEPFRTSKARGAGLGLAVCKKIAESCGGSIAVKDAPSGGALFMVILPLAQPEGTL